MIADIVGILNWYNFLAGKLVDTNFPNRDIEGS